MAFKFKQFRVEDGRCAMKVGTDAGLLGAWAPGGEHVRALLDAGAGCGVVALLMAGRCPQARVAAVELDPAAAEDCRANVAASPWANRISVECQDVTAYQPAEPVDLLVSNPPFFTETLRAPDQRRAAARHGDVLSPLTVIDLGARVLSDDGLLAMITDCRSRDDILFHAALRQLNPLRITAVSSRAGKPPFRLLWLMGRHSGPLVTDTLAIRTADNAWSPEYADLVSPYYLRMPGTNDNKRTTE